MLSFKILRTLCHGGKVQLLRNMQDVAPEGWRNNGAFIDRVDISFGARHPSGLKVRSDFFSLSNANRWGQQRIAAAPEFLRGELGIRLKIYDLTPRMDAGICAACSLHIQALLRQLLY